MPSTQLTPRIRWLQAQSPTSTTMLDISIYLLVMSLMFMVSVYGYVRVQRHLRLMEALSVFAGARVSMMEYRAVTGSWPTSNNQAAFSFAMFNGNDTDQYRVNSVQIREGGAIDLKFSGAAFKDKVVSIRGWEWPNPGLPVEWICGHAPSLPGTTAAADQTTITDSDLPSPCRAHR